MNLENASIYSMQEIPFIKYLGRGTSESVIEKNKAILFWSASGFTVCLKGSEIWALVECSFSTYEIWCCVEVNGRIISRTMLSKGKNWMCLMRGYPVNAINTITFYRDSQPMPTELEQYLIIHQLAIKNSSQFHPLSDKQFRIEFIGDSITSGEGLAGAPSEKNWMSAWISSSDTYAVQTARILDADFQIISQCGWGVITSWNNNPNDNIPRIYEKRCGLMIGEFQESLGSQIDHPIDSSQWSPDVIVVNLGTNDDIAFRSPAWVNKKLGVQYKLRTDAQGAATDEDGMKFARGVMDFLITLRKIHPNAIIVWVWGMMEIPIVEPYLNIGLDLYIKEHDQKVYRIKLPSKICEKYEKDKGSRGHPGPKTHRKAAELLSGFIQKIINDQ